MVMVMLLVRGREESRHGGQLVRRDVACNEFGVDRESMAGSCVGKVGGGGGRGIRDLIWELRDAGCENR